MIFIVQYDETATKTYNLIVRLTLNQTTGGCVYVTEQDTNRRRQAGSDHCRGSARPRASGEDLSGAGAQDVPADLCAVRARIHGQETS